MPFVDTFSITKVKDRNVLVLIEDTSAWFLTQEAVVFSDAGVSVFESLPELDLHARLQRELDCYQHHFLIPDLLDSTTIVCQISLRSADPDAGRAAGILNIGTVDLNA